MRYVKENHEVINETNFKVKSAEGVKLRDASKANEQCAVNSCKMVCSECELCSHEYT